MPYIDKDARWEIDAEKREPKTPGELNYHMTQIIKQYLSGGMQGYTEYNEVLGVLECMKLEIYRRLVAPYEDFKRDQNGEVFNF